MAEIEYSYELCNEWRRNAENKIERFQGLLKEIQLVEDLHHFGNVGEFKREFMENEFAEWVKNDASANPDANKYVEERLQQIPFEQAYYYKNPNGDAAATLNSKLKEWSNHPDIAKNMFEYMCYYVINTREELLFDIRERM